MGFICIRFPKSERLQRSPHRCGHHSEALIGQHCEYDSEGPQGGRGKPRVIPGRQARQQNKYAGHRDRQKSERGERVDAHHLLACAVFFIDQANPDISENIAAHFWFRLLRLDRHNLLVRIEVAPTFNMESPGDRSQKLKLPGAPETVSCV